MKEPRGSWPHIALVLCLTLPLLSCGPLHTMERDHALYSLKQGALNVNDYTNSYYNCSALGPATWTAYLGYPEYLVQFIAPDKVSMAKLAIVEPEPGQRLSLHDVITMYTRGKQTYHSIQPKDQNDLVSTCKVLRYENKLDDNPARELMKTVTWACVGNIYGYILETTAPLSLYSMHQTAFGDIFSSFKFVNNAVDKQRLTAQQPEPEPPKSPHGTQHHVVAEGETLALIAQKYLGNPNLWQKIAEANGIDNPRDLKKGDTLVIPLEAPPTPPTKKKTAKNDAAALTTNSPPPANPAASPPATTATKPTAPATAPNQYNRPLPSTEQTTHGSVPATTMATTSARPHQPSEATGKEPAPTQGKVTGEAKDAAPSPPPPPPPPPASGSGASEVETCPSVEVIRTPLDGPGKKSVPIMSGPGPAPVYQAIGDVKFGERVQFVARAENYVEVAKEGKRGYLFADNTKCIGKK